MITARTAAVRALLAIGSQQATLSAAMDDARADLSDPRDRGLALEIVSGTLRWQQAIDRIITQASRRSTRQIDLTALVVLRTAIYQLRYLDRIPAHAVVSESVGATRVLGAGRATGFVNAVLRSVLRRGRTLNLPASPGGTGAREAQLAYLGVTLSHPLWLVERWLDRYGFDAATRICQWNNTSPAVTVRVAPGSSIDDVQAEIQRLGFTVDRAPFVDDALRLAPGVLGRLDPAVAACVRVQDEGAQLVARSAGVTPGERVLDICAAPGGKSIVLARDLDHSVSPGRLVAADHRTTRVALLASTLRAQGVAAGLVRLDARQPLPFAETFDCVLVDVPCSGLGTLGRDPDLKWSRTAADLPGLAETELRILSNAADAVRPGGRLVYATCSSEPEENEAIVDAFLARDSRFTAGSVGSQVAPALTTVRGHLFTRPDLHNLGFYFAAVMVRR